jgi:hypothetical protein
MVYLCPQCPKGRPESARKLHKVKGELYKCHQGHWFQKKDGEFVPYDPNKTDLR